MNKQMNREKFTQKVTEQVREQITDAVIESRTIIKNNGVRHTGIAVCKEDRNVVPFISIDGAYEEYQEGRKMEEIVKDVMEIYGNSGNLGLEEKVSSKQLGEWEWVKDKVMMKLVNTEKNQEMLKNHPSTPFLNLSCIYYISLEIQKCECCSTNIKNSSLQIWGVTVEELHNQALENMKKYVQDELKPMSQVLAEILLENEDREFAKEMGSLVVELIEPQEEISMYVLSNVYRINGAASLVYSNKVKELAERLEKDLYIIPSSVHEVILVPVKGEEREAEELKEMVLDVNDTMVDPAEVLSESVYCYERESGEIRIVI